jgi:hypothetical protein
MFTAVVKFAVSLARVTELCRIHSARQDWPTEPAAADQSKREVGICIDTSICEERNKPVPHSSWGARPRVYVTLKGGGTATGRNGLPVLIEWQPVKIDLRA